MGVTPTCNDQVNAVALDDLLQVLARALNKQDILPSHVYRATLDLILQHIFGSINHASARVQTNDAVIVGHERQCAQRRTATQIQNSSRLRWRRWC